ncbi:EVE domain-containing protein [Trichormus variabilis]|uniref:EVE domain-containing protein n=1 Tax=Trichormus variabilis SAG 1403-4b TaxID=447716 RepID=A0A3S1C4C1_ANAVA|nr:EVE domain-containing protein [Trichormus variabilis]MBD2624978.1 EVE domain-containing protein [Trichormus variabilis FACHB-164]RUS95087.1 hypothetical protein DSM107003_32870 [Trichormus variabilis SAG 1403-4b]
MADWLLKTEPENYSYFDLEPDCSTVWDGVNDLVRLPRLSVVPVSDFHWQHLRDLAENIN